VLTLAPKRLLSVGIVIGDDVTVELAADGSQRGGLAGHDRKGGLPGAIIIGDRPMGSAYRLRHQPKKSLLSS
jgi:hypothetical protein